MPRTDTWKSRLLLTGTCLLLAVALQPWPAAGAQAPQAVTDVEFARISPDDMRTWLTYLASDELQGRQVFTEGYGLASQYVADHLKEWGLEPLGDDGTYFQPVKQRGYKVTRASEINVAVGGDSRTFAQGDHVEFSFNSGGDQALTFHGVEFIGSSDETLAGRDVAGKLVVWMPSTPPGQGGGFRGRRGNPGSTAINSHGAAAAIGFVAAPAPSPAEDSLAEAEAALGEATAAVTRAQQQLRGGGRGGFRGGRGGAAAVEADITSVQNVELPVPPQLTADETFFELLLGNAPTSFADLQAMAERGDPLPAFSLPDADVTITIDNTFEVVSERLTQNVVGMVRGSDPALSDTYVLFGAHLDHVGYNESGNGRGPTPTACRQRGEAAIEALTAAGKTPQNPGRGFGGGGGGRGPAASAPALPFDQRDFIYNGADDDGSGSTALLAVAKAFATGPKPKRSVVFVWHAGEEAGLLGSRYNADFPVVPLDKVQAQLNMDMVGRDDCDDIEGDYSNSVFVVGADRISTDLHNIIVETNETLAQPLTLDYELNDPADPESVYTRSDHYSYAAKGIPIAFLTTGLHPDYHRVSDEVDKIEFEKMARIAQLVYQTGFSIADTDRVLVRDNKGPRTGFGTKAEIIH